MSQWSNPDGSPKLIASYTAEQTARYFAGGDLGRPEIHDPEIKSAMDRQRNALRKALRTNVDVLVAALKADSQNTARRLTELHRAAEAGNVKAAKLLVAMLDELVKFALS